MTLGDMILRRKRLGMRQYDLAKLVGLSQGAIIDIENERLHLSKDLAAKIDAAFTAEESRRDQETTAATA